MFIFKICEFDSGLGFGFGFGFGRGFSLEFRELYRELLFVFKKFCKLFFSVEFFFEVL